MSVLEFGGWESMGVVKIGGCHDCWLPQLKLPQLGLSVVESVGVVTLISVGECWSCRCVIEGFVSVGARAGGSG